MLFKRVPQYAGLVIPKGELCVVRADIFVLLLFFAHMSQHGDHLPLYPREGKEEGKVRGTLMSTHCAAHQPYTHYTPVFACACEAV